MADIKKLAEAVRAQRDKEKAQGSSTKMSVKDIAARSGQPAPAAPATRDRLPSPTTGGDVVTARALQATKEAQRAHPLDAQDKHQAAAKAHLEAAGIHAQAGNEKQAEAHRQAAQREAASAITSDAYKRETYEHEPPEVARQKAEAAASSGGGDDRKRDEKGRFA